MPVIKVNKPLAFVMDAVARNIDSAHLGRNWDGPAVTLYELFLPGVLCSSM